ncbi:replicative DNA helicase, partial [Streptococcus pneumoniae]
LSAVMSVLSEEDFYRNDHRLIYRAICELSEKNQPFDAVTLGEWFERHNMQNQIGGSVYLSELVNDTPSAANIDTYAKIVLSKSMYRQI